MTSPFAGRWNAGVEFIDENGGGPGVRLRKPQQNGIANSLCTGLATALADPTCWPQNDLLRLKKLRPSPRKTPILPKSVRAARPKSLRSPEGMLRRNEDSAGPAIVTSAAS